MTKKKKKAKRLHCREEGCKWTCSMSLPFNERMAKLRRHRKKKHIKAHKKSVKKTLKTKQKKGLINKKGSNHKYRSYKSGTKLAFHIGEKHHKIKMSQVARCKNLKDLTKLHRKAHKKKKGNPCK